VRLSGTVGHEEIFRCTGTTVAFCHYAPRCDHRYEHVHAGAWIQQLFCDVVSRTIMRRGIGVCDMQDKSNEEK
jgi:hypothetical protein